MKHDVFWFDVSVDDILLMEYLIPSDDFFKKLSGLNFTEPSALLIKVLLEITTITKI